jgi:Zn-dependent protease with chaperone function
MTTRPPSLLTGPSAGGQPAPTHAATQGDVHLLPARWYDGLSSKARPVLVGLQPAPQGPALVLHPLSQPGAAPRVFSHDQVAWPQAWNARRPQLRVVVDLREHGSLEIDAVAQWHAALAAAGARPGLAQRMQTRWPVLLAMAVAAALGVALFYRYGTPWAATQLTRYVPLSWETSLAENALQQMDDGTLKPSKLPAERQAQLRARFDQLAQQTPPALQRYRGYAPRLTLAFRSGMGANAFALPGGTVVMTDALVRAAAGRGLDDNALVGVLAHEIGHVAHRHTTRMLVEQGVLNVGLGLALGDVSSVLSTGGSLLTGLAYRRNHEREADCFAIALLRHAALPTAPMGQLLLAIAQGEEKTAAGTGKQPDANKAPQPGAQRAGGVWSWLSSHPDTVERATELERGHAPHCTAP